MTSARVLISGSIAFDTLMVFEGRFGDHILPDRLHQLSVSFLVPQMKREPGGCAANIAYNMRLLGGEPAILAAVGADGAQYRQRLQDEGVNVDQVHVLDTMFTAQCFVTTDQSSNQINAFHPGAMNEAHCADPAALAPAAWGIVSPNGKAAMIAHAQQLAALKIPFVFDPGQGLPMFSGEELRELVRSANALTVNDYEFGMLVDKTGWGETELVQEAGTAVVTLGGKGSNLYEGGQGPTHIAPVPAERVVDPTGCGDAFRGGLMFGLASGWDWQRACRLGSVLGSLKIAVQGPQNHRPSRDDIARVHQQTYGERPW